MHQQIGYMLAPLSCQSRLTLVPLVTLFALALALIGGWLSYGPWRSFRTLEEGKLEASERTQYFIATLSLLFTALFLFAILLQGAGELFFNGCQR
jgi:hypothetical protein